MLLKPPTNLPSGARPEPANANSRHIEVVCEEGEDFEAAKIRLMLGPHLANARAAVQFAGKQSGEYLPIGPFAAAMVKSAERIGACNMKDVEAMLASQAITLNFMFGELGCLAASNMGTNSEASERFMRMALKAQNQSRMTLETLSNIKNPPVIYARQANIAHGPQQVNNGRRPRTHAEESQNQPNKILEQGDEQRMDNPAKSQTGASNSRVEALATGNRA